METRSETTYLIPLNVNTRFELIEGFGWKDLAICLLTAGATFLLMNTVGFFLSTLSTMMKLCVVIGSTAISFFIVQRNPVTGMSMLMLLTSWREYEKNQKRYLYKYGGCK